MPLRTVLLVLLSASCCCTDTRLETVFQALHQLIPGHGHWDEVAKSVTVALIMIVAMTVTVAVIMIVALPVTVAMTVTVTAAMTVTVDIFL